MDIYDDEDEFFYVDLGYEIKKNEIVKTTKAVFIGTLIIPTLSFVSGGLISLFPGTGLIIKTIIKILLCSMIFPIPVGLFTIFNINKNKSYWKDYCDSYEIYKNDKKEKIFKILLKSGKTVFIDSETCKIINSKNIEDIGENNNDNKSKTDDFSSQQNTELDSSYSSKENKYTIMNYSKFQLDFSIGREKEIERLEESLIMNSVNPLIIGPTGVGKTALVKGLVYKIQNGDVPTFLKNKKIGRIDTSDLVSGCQYVGSFEKKMKEFIKFAKEEDTIFFIDEFHTLIGAGTGNKNNIDAANILKPYLSEGYIKIIGATTEEEYEKYIKSDSAFLRRFEVVKLTEPNEKTLFDIVNVHVSRFEKIYNVKFSINELEKKARLDLLIELTSKKNRKYNIENNNPSLILSILERSFVKSKMQNNNLVSIGNLCDAINLNTNFYDSAIKKTIDKLNNVDSSEIDSVEKSQKVFKISKIRNV